MELRALKYLITVAEEGNMSRAAARLFISQPAISRQIRELEEEWGVTLFVRKSQGMSLTSEGEVAFHLARKVLSQAVELENTMKGLGSERPRRLSIGYIATALPGFLSKALRRFYDQYPEINLEIREMNPVHQVEALESGDLDLALLGTACDSLSDRFQVVHLARIPLGVALPDHHLVALRKSVNLSDLSEEKWITLDEKLFPGRRELIEKLEKSAGQALKIQSKAQSLSEIIGRVATGAGIAVLPMDVAQLPHPNVVFIKLRTPRIYMFQSAVWNRETEAPELLTLIEWLKEAGSNYCSVESGNRKT